MSALRQERNVSFWWNGVARQQREAVVSHLEADVVIVGAGYTGLWVAYYLAEAAPELRIVIVEGQYAGFGASGRNGGWLTSAIAGQRHTMARKCGRQGVVDLQQTMIETVDEVILRMSAENIDADLVKGGVLQVARNPAQLRRLDELAIEEAEWGDRDAKRLTADESLDLVNVEGTLGGHFSPHTAKLNPAKLVTGLAEAVERRGVSIYERSPVTSIKQGRVETPRGSVKAPVVITCTEGFTAALPRQRRSLLPMNSSMIVTAPLPEVAWKRIGWSTFPVLGDLAHSYMYAQRTADNRIALGGRGKPYRFGSGTDLEGETPAKTVRQLIDVLHSMFPETRDARIETAWSGVLGVPRDWCARFHFDSATGLGSASGYTGHGVATANLAGRVMRDLVLGRTTPLTETPHVNWQGPMWEPEPLRWAGVQAMYAAYRSADRTEARSRSASTSVLARVANVVSGRH